jgi:hypothetical protein
VELDCKFLGANCVEFYSIGLVWGKFSGKILYSFGRQINWNWTLQFWEWGICVKLVCISLGATCVELDCIILGCILCVTGLYNFLAATWLEQECIGLGANWVKLDCICLGVKYRGTGMCGFVGILCGTGI